MTANPADDLRSLESSDKNRDAPIAFGLAAARPTAGMIAPNSFYWATDTAALSFSNGTTWTDLTAGIAATVIDAKGDLLVGTAADAIDNLAVGANYKLLMADSSQSAGVTWGPIVKAGSAFIANVQNNTTHSVGVTFTTAFPSTPTVVVGLDGMNSTSSLNNGIWCAATGVSSSGFTMVICGGGLGSNDVTATWIATTAGNS